MFSHSVLTALAWLLQMVTDQDIEGSTCLHLAVDNGHYEVAKLCLEKRKHREKNSQNLKQRWLPVLRKRIKTHEMLKLLCMKIEYRFLKISNIAFYTCRYWCKWMFTVSVLHYYCYMSQALPACSVGALENWPHYLCVGDNVKHSDLTENTCNLHCMVCMG